ncbi:MAG: glycosyltransferase family 2 protein [Aeriscardovia sp.]|nr:glycosyltransferase family 2 protein [Aeriscardovia sp.]
MRKIKFANIIFENPLQEERHSRLFYRGSGEAWKEGESRFLSPGSHFDFTTYFNSLSVAKIRLYTPASSFSLHLELRGGGCKVFRGRAQNFSHEGEFESCGLEVKASPDWQIFDLPFDPKEGDVLLAFCLDTFGEKVEVGECYWELGVPEVLETRLAIVSTTFKKEPYIQKTIRALKEGFFKDFPLSHFFVIDNGRTLDPDLGGENVSIVANPNVGGSGGFAKGMLEALKPEGGFTHVLLMDDDVEICTESVKRTARLLSILRPEWRGAFVAGAMLNLDNKNLQMEDAGYMTAKGRFAPQKPVLGMDQVEGLVRNETFEPEGEMRSQGYASWWYCAIPVKEVERVGLPLPLFLRGDDAEYSLRAGAKLITMNSIGLWHMAFQVKYSAAVERYQVVRNVFAARFATGFAPDSDFLLDMKNSIRLELKKFGYDNASLVLDGFEDFLRGPRFLSNPLRAEEAFKRANRAQEQMLDFDALQARAKNIPELQNFDVYSLTYQSIHANRPRMVAERLIDFAAQNGQRFIQTRGEGYAVIPAEGWEYPAGEIRGKRVLVLIDWFNRRGCIRTKDRERFEQISKRYARDLRYFKAHTSHLRSIWASAGATFTTPSFWEAYLKRAASLEE